MKIRLIFSLFIFSILTSCVSTLETVSSEDLALNEDRMVYLGFTADFKEGKESFEIDYCRLYFQNLDDGSKFLAPVQVGKDDHILVKFPAEKSGLYALKNMKCSGNLIEISSLGMNKVFYAHKNHVKFLGTLVVFFGMGGDFIFDDNYGYDRYLEVVQGEATAYLR
ncbi:MAG: hypothetical protein HRU09_19050 [Oligoflexales bacterium]|nr:hypothetical protein [Oligoflexales bacterium]